MGTDHHEQVIDGAMAAEIDELTVDGTVDVDGVVLAIRGVLWGQN